MADISYNTKQKKLIEKVLTRNPEVQFTCEDVASLLKTEGTPVGKTTVYRYLENLSKTGRVRKSQSLDGKSSVYQYIDDGLDCEGHLHLRCTSCGRLFHLGCEFMSGVGEHIRMHHNFIIDNSKTVIYGICESCRG